jgi:hypothetical protein
MKKWFMKRIISLLTAIVVSLNSFSQSVGIGTPAPHASAQLDITSINKGLLPPRMTTAQRNAIASPASGLIVYQTDGTPGIYYYNGSSWQQLSTGSATNYWTSLGSVIFNNNSGGNVTIGGFTTLARFTVLGDAAIYDNQSLLIFRNAGTSGNYSQVRFQEPDGTNEFSITHASNCLRLSIGTLISTSPAFAIDVNGNVGIGTINPAAKFHVQSNMMIGAGTPASGYSLSVNGKIMSEEVRVELDGDWPDYVFEENYKLPSLKQLESFISSNKHLPNIPAAKQVKKEGFDLGDMNKRLLEKIEELTLYIIEQDKKINAIQQQLLALKLKQ